MRQTISLNRRQKNSILTTMTMNKYRVETWLSSKIKMMKVSFSRHLFFFFFCCHVSKKCVWD